jgi:hypothetical protein
MKKYYVHLTQKFEDTPCFEANSKEEAEQKAIKEWGEDVSAEVTIHSVEETK